MKEEPESPEAQPYVPRDWQRQYVFVAATMPDVGDKSVGAEIGQVSGKYQVYPISYSLFDAVPATCERCIRCLPRPLAERPSCHSFPSSWQPRAVFLLARQKYGERAGDFMKRQPTRSHNEGQLESAGVLFCAFHRFNHLKGQGLWASQQDMHVSEQFKMSKYG